MSKVVSPIAHLYPHSIPPLYNEEFIEDCITSLMDQCHWANVQAGWWTDPQTIKPAERNFGEMIALCHSELSEALEGDRKDLMDDKLPHRKMREVELADALIRIFDLAAACDMDLAGAFVEKMRYNATRVDHTLAHRASENGKKY